MNLNKYKRNPKTWLVSEVIANDAVNALCRAAQSNLSQGTNASGQALEAAFGIVNGPSVDLSPQDVQERLEMPAAPVAQADPRPILTPETVDAIPDGVCEAIYDAWHKNKAPIIGQMTVAGSSREFIRAVAAHCRVEVPKPSSDSGQLPTERPARALSDDEACSLFTFCSRTLSLADTTKEADGRRIYAEALRLAGRKVERDGETPSSGWVGPDSPASYWIKPSAPVASVELSGAEHDAWNRVFGWDSIVVLRELNRILAARKAKDVADMQPPFEGPVRGFSATERKQRD